jgi:hypothetical protein
MSARQRGFGMDARANIEAAAFYFLFNVRSFGPGYSPEFGRAL